MLKQLLSVGAAALASLVAGCRDAAVTQPGGWRSAASWSALVNATAEGPLWLRVEGRPFGDVFGGRPSGDVFGGRPSGDDTMSGPALADVVARVMSNRLVGRQVGLTARRELAPRPEFVVIVVFNPPPALTAAQVCAGRIAFARPERTGKVAALAAFCDAGGLLASASGHVGGVTGPDDDRFHQWLGQLTRDLLGGP